jgi:hypothetical protein
MVPKKIKQNAIKLRDAGHSYKYIEKSLGIPRSTLSGWFAGRPFNPNHYTLEKIRNGPKISAQKRIHERILRTQAVWDNAAANLGNLTDRDLLLLGIGLYMGEGSKTGSIVRFSNSDPLLIKVFLSWMKNHFGVANTNFALRVHSYLDVDITKVENYWLKTTGLPNSCLRPTFIEGRAKLSAKSGKLPYGTAHVTVLAAGNYKFGVQLFRSIQGYILTVTKKYAGFV